MHLHALLDDFIVLEIITEVDKTQILPSKGFIKASLAIVAQAPEVAVYEVRKITKM